MKRRNLLSRRLLVRLYPRAWRDRYGEEFALLLDAEPVTGTVVANVIGAATRQWLLRTRVGPIVLAIAVTWAAGAVARYLTVAFPMEPSIQYGGLTWGPWPAYVGLSKLLLWIAVPARCSYAVSSRASLPIRHIEFGAWVAAFAVTEVFNQWGDMVSRRPAFGHADDWFMELVMLAVAFVWLRCPTELGNFIRKEWPANR